MLLELLRRSAWLTAGGGAGRLLPVLVMLAASRSMNDVAYATAGAGFAWASVAPSLSSTGLATVMMQRLGALDRADQQQLVLRRCLRWSMGAAALLAVMAALLGPWAAQRFFAGGIDTRVIWPAIVAGFAWSQVAVVAAALNGCHRARAAASVMAQGGLLQGLAMLPALLLSDDPALLIAALALGSVLALGLALWRLRHERVGTAPTTFAAADLITWRAVRSPVLWQTIAAAAVLPAGFLASGLLARGPDAAHQLALHFFLEQALMVLATGPAMLGQALLPMMARSLHEARQQSLPYTALMRRPLKLAALFCAAGFTVVALLTIDTGWMRWVAAHSVVGPADEPAVWWLLGSAALVPGMSLVGGLIQARGEIARAARLNLVWLACYLGLAIANWGGGAAGLQQARCCASIALLLGAGAYLWFSAARAAGTLADGER